MFELTAFQRDIMLVTAGLDDPKGTEIHEELDRYYEDDVYFNRLYRSLDDLVDLGLVAKAKNGRANEYSLTEGGKELIDQRHAWKADHVGL